MVEQGGLAGLVVGRSKWVGKWLVLRVLRVWLLVLHAKDSLATNTKASSPKPGQAEPLQTLQR